ncbi:MAG: biotin transporter BioY [Chloroflexaceae bacterium]|jgi:biotin transport system substrate-specific component|nr:biotin transporter BioY [Chloroflexaceae bacterium]
MAAAGTHTGTLAQRLLPRRGVLERPWIRDGLLVVAGTLLMILSARISFPLPTTTVPVTMQTFAVLLLGALYGPRLGAITMLTYIGTGLLGMPVFSLGRNAWTPTPFFGLPLIVSSTAGYLYSYPLVAALVGWLANQGWDRRVRSAIPAMLLGNLVILLCGFAWLAGATALFTGTLDIPALLMAAVVPFLLGDAAKLLLAAFALPGGWLLLGRR